jgi:5-methylcytosine-specific restriction endonuclease McrA
MNRKKKIREDFRDTVFARDKSTCRICGKTNAPLDAHHIMDADYFDNGGYVEENGISLCAECHLSAEKYHMTNAQQWVFGLHPDDLYRMIDSSFEKAIAADKRNRK